VVAFRVSDTEPEKFQNIVLVGFKNKFTLPNMYSDDKEVMTLLSRAFTVSASANDRVLTDDFAPVEKFFRNSGNL
jgi:hypothetical protein